MSDNISEEDVWGVWEDAAVALRTRAVIGKILLVLSHMTIIGNGTVIEMRELLDEMASDPQKGVRFILRFDAVLKEGVELHKSVITETFIREINDAIDLFNPEREEPFSDPFAQIGNDYSRLYGKDSAWN